MNQLLRWKLALRGLEFGNVSLLCCTQPPRMDWDLYISWSKLCFPELPCPGEHHDPWHGASSLNLPTPLSPVYVATETNGGSHHMHLPSQAVQLKLWMLSSCLPAVGWEKADPKAAGAVASRAGARFRSYNLLESTGLTHNRLFTNHSTSAHGHFVHHIWKWESSKVASEEIETV